MLLDDIIQRVQSAYSKGVHSDDTRLSSRHIYNKIVTVRSKLLSLKARKKQKISQWNYQTLPCVEMEKVPIHDCPCIPPLGCYIFRSKFQIPEVVVDLNQHIIQSVTSLDSRTNYSPTTWEDMKNLDGNKYTSKYPRYFIRNDYMYVLDTKQKVLTITAVFQDPIVVEQFPSFCGDTEVVDCSSYLDRDFNVSNDLIDALIELAAAELIGVFNKGIEDSRNDGRDNPPKETK